MSGLTDLDHTLAALDATPHGTYVFATVPEVPDGLRAFAVIEEDEGTTVIADTDQAQAHDLPLDQTFARITLGVHTPLDSVGLTATIAQTLASRSIACNVVAGYHHDHLFVQADRASEAWALLDDLARQAKGWLPQS